MWKWQIPHLAKLHVRTNPVALYRHNVSLLFRRVTGGQGGPGGGGWNPGGEWQVAGGRHAYGGHLAHPPGRRRSSSPARGHLALTWNRHYRICAYCVQYIQTYTVHTLTHSGMSWSFVCPSTCSSPILPADRIVFHITFSQTHLAVVRVTYDPPLHGTRTDLYWKFSELFCLLSISHNIRASVCF